MRVSKDISSPVDVSEKAHADAKKDSGPYDTPYPLACGLELPEGMNGDPREAAKQRT
jgi:hypothetical protein